MSTKFSLLMSVYAKESPLYLDESLKSVWTDQNLKPSEIVLVKDGPLTKDLEDVIQRWTLLLNEKLMIVSMETNAGLGKALNIGLTHCSFELVARMDTDDISLPNRFEIQVKEFEADPNLSLCGTFITEFITDDPSYSATRTVPLSMEQIKGSCGLRNPFNHPSVMFKKSKILEAGGYRHMPAFEDYYLWLRVLAMGVKAKNLPISLLNMRIDNGQLERRSGFSYLKQEINFYKKLVRDNLVTYPSFLILTLLRAPLRILPKRILGQVYKMGRRSRPGKSHYLKYL